MCPGPLLPFARKVGADDETDAAEQFRRRDTLRLIDIAGSAHRHRGLFHEKQGFEARPRPFSVTYCEIHLVAPQIDPDVVFPITTQSHHYFGCYGGAMAVLECLLGHLVALGGEEAQQRIADYEATREDSGAYYKAGRTPRIRS